MSDQMKRIDFETEYCNIAAFVVCISKTSQSTLKIQTMLFLKRSLLIIGILQKKAGKVRLKFAYFHGNQFD